MYWDPNTRMCWNCGIGIRDAMKQANIGFPCHKPIWQERNYKHPLATLILWYRLEKIDDPNSPYTCREIEECDPKLNTPEEIETYCQMVAKR